MGSGQYLPLGLLEINKKPRRAGSKYLTPNAPENPYEIFDAAIFKEEFQEYGTSKNGYREKSTMIYSVVFGQRTEAHKARSKFGATRTKFTRITT